MTDYLDTSDDELLRLVRDALAGRDVVPPEVVALAKAAPDLAGLDQAVVDWELAALVADSAADLAGVRGDGSGRQLDFAGARAELVVVVADAAGTGGAVELTGQLVPGAVATVEVVRAGSVVRSTITDRLGRFRIVDLPAGRLRLRVPAVRLLTPAFVA